MKNCFTALLLCCLLLSCTDVRNKKNMEYAVAFYNLENLFDTTHDFRKNDTEYLPGTANDWNEEKYQSKLTNMSRVLAELGTDRIEDGPALIGLAEVENRKVVEDLVKQPALASRGYEVLHIEGPDERGIDCAFLYNPKYITLTNLYLEPYQYDVPEKDAHLTRGFLVASGIMACEPCHFIVCHWPSRSAESHARELAGAQVKALKEKLQAQNPTCKIFIMGDMNDDPSDPSMAISLGARKEMAEVEENGLFNPWWADWNPDSVGTLLYRGKWNHFDQIVFTKNMLHANKKQLHYDSHKIWKKDYLIQQDGKYKGSPLRTFGSGQWLNGYSDHLPIVLYLKR